MNARTYNPSVPADDRQIFSFGVGHSWGNHSVDLTYSLLMMESTRVAGNVVPAFNGTYDYNWDILTISYSRKF